MKTLFTFALAGLLATSSLAAKSNEDLMAMSNVNAKFKKINVLLKEGVGEAKIAILDKFGKKLHQRKVQATDRDVVVPYDLNTLPCGEYQVMITTDEEQIFYSVETFEKPQPIEEYPLMAYGKQIDDHTVNLSVIGLEEPGVNVKIKSQKGNRTILEENIDQAEGFKKNYKFEGLSPEEIYFEITDAKGRSRTLYF
ncbi:MAG: hypothetical protein PSV36_11185 [Algoriphagus sp.]|nr:hypothetical protein [Algoriphagus sp.]